MMKLDNVLDPKLLRKNLISISLFIAGFEILKDSVVDRIIDFYADTHTSEGPQISDKYLKQLSLKNKKEGRVEASLTWLRKREIISEEDRDSFREIRKYRNKLAHELYDCSMRGVDDEFIQKFHGIQRLINKIETWWIRNVEMATSDEYVDIEVTDEDISPGTLLMLQMMVEVAVGDEETVDRYSSILHEIKKMNDPK